LQVSERLNGPSISVARVSVERLPLATSERTAAHADSARLATMTAAAGGAVTLRVRSADGGSVVVIDTLCASSTIGDVRRILESRG
jgi:hypothetical protein